MRHNLFFLLLLILLDNHYTRAQNPIFVSQGQIEYEYKINLYAQMSDETDEDFKELIKKNTPQFKSTYFNLVFDHNKSIYRPGKENLENNNLWFGDNVASENVVFNDLEKLQSVSQKKVFDKTFLIKDSTRKINWKITNETRKIAGFECRRANAIIMDSIYVVAFYTDEIITPGGPESFTGLPGMILGVAIPHEHITWFATKLMAVPVKETDIVEPIKGKPSNNAALKETLKQSLKDWGKYGERYVKQAML